MRLLFLSFLWLFIPAPDKAQANFPYAGFTGCSWQGITLVDSSYKSKDTCFVIVSTRNPLKPITGHPEFLGQQIASDSLLRFYTIYFNGNSWKAAPRKNLEAAIGETTLSPDFAVYTEGDGKTFPANTDRATRLCRLYNVSVIMFDWPSRIDGYKAIRNVRNTVRNSKALGKQFHSFLLLLQDYKFSHPGKMSHVTLFCHSLGNAVLKNSLVKYGNSTFQHGLIDNLILNASCIPVRHHAAWIEQLHFQSNLYVVYNRKDKTLREASILFHQRLLGCQLHRPLASNALYVNIHPVAGNKHNYFLIIPLLKEHPELKSFFYDILHAGSPDFSNPAVFIEKKFKRQYLLL